jgi:hypothetical protein
MTLTAQFERIDDIRRLKYGYVTGAAGRGKTTIIQEILKQDPFWGIVSATTGVAAMNLGAKLRRSVPTIFSLLKCANVAEFRRSFESGALEQKIRALKHKQYQRVVIDECSMLLAEIFSYIYRACKAVDIGLILVGDFAQLGPVVKFEHQESIPKPPWAFQSMYWPEFTDGKSINDGRGIIRLQKNYRQASPEFNQLLDLLRVGDGAGASRLVQSTGCELKPSLDDNFSGVTLTVRNSFRDLINLSKFSELQGMTTEYKKTSYGEQRKEWLDIPRSIALKIGSHAMILRNQYSGGRLVQANGTVGTVLSMYPDYITMHTSTGLGEKTAITRNQTESRSPERN